jgi:Fe2+ transport system protein B
MSHASAAAFPVVTMLFIPRAGAIGVLKKEMNSRKWFYGATLFSSCFGGMTAGDLGKRTGGWVAPQTVNAKTLL